MKTYHEDWPKFSELTAEEKVHVLEKLLDTLNVHIKRQVTTHADGRVDTEMKLVHLP